MQRDQAIFEEWDEWYLDVRESDNLLLVTLPFSEVRLHQSDMDDLTPPDELPDTEAIWGLSQHA